ncbi:putative sulfate exporter family transporter [Halobellus sp. GM3]|uniref:putative sulfate exporter family transporter n=1 Tax=Halobellus sp. GM3 TaxID=3458410 RepID=UPI00403E178A
MTANITARNTAFGVGLLVLGAILARAVGEALPWPDPLLVAVVIGVLFGNVVGVPERLEPGVRTHGVWLGAGIVLMGASVSLGSLLAGGAVVLAFVVAVAAFTIVFLEVIARNALGICERLGSLLAAGTSICGVSAVAAVAGSIDADEGTIAYAAGTVLLFDAVTLALYPAVGSALAIPDRVFGVWAGVSMFSTGPVVAAGFAHSEIAGQWATVTKLGRNALIGLVVLAYAAYYAGRGTDSNPGVRALWAEFPKFVLGFLALAVAASVGVFSAGQVTALEHAYNWLFLIAFVGLGTELQRSVFAESGLKPIAAVFLTWSVVASVTLPAIWLVLG